MLQRKAMDRLLSWKKSGAKKCLIVEGASQIGKTYIIEKFGEQNYRSFIELNFIQNPSLINIFKGDLNTETILTGIRLYLPGSEIIEGDTLIFLDEIQECEEAITALKFLAADRRISVICSGSALGIKYKQHSTSYPVGSVDYLFMNSLDFEEFLWAMNVDSDTISMLGGLFRNKKYDTRVPFAVHTRMLSLLKQYMVIGGMPEAVQKFSDTGDYHEVDIIQRRLYQDYINDIARYALPDIKIKAERCYKSIPLQLSKENHKFQYGMVEHRGTSAKFDSSIDWLTSAHMAIAVNNLSAVDYPLKSYADSSNFRIYPNDIGLLVCTYGYELKAAILQDSGIETPSADFVLGRAKGGLYEALAAEILFKRGYEDLHFYRNKAGTVEIEFVIEGTDGIVPVEIKAGRKHSRSLSAILESENIRYGYKFSSQNIGMAGKKITMPIYMLMFI